MSRRVAGISSYLNNTRVQPVTHSSRPRPLEEQEPTQAQWAETRRRERRQTELDEELQMMKIEGIMTGVGICAAVLAGIGILALMIYHLNWWVVPALASAIFLGWIIRFKED
ncbi:MAG: hypothetical protein ABFD04_11630 [Syntrophomonas sp.]